jgi:tetratricopeptide (TPR) repeat protein
LVVVLFVALDWRVSFPKVLQPKAQPELLELSNQGRYSEVLNWTADILSERPLEPEALFFRGVAHFYLSLAEMDRGNISPRLEQTIIALRRARLTTEFRYRKEAAYLMGKAYYHKGLEYYNLAISYLNESLEQGYQGEDTNEYLGMAYVRSGDLKNGLIHFLAALEENKTGVLHMSIGEILLKLDEREKAAKHLESAVINARSQELEIRARQMLGELLLRSGNLVAAGQQFQQIIAKAPESADAHLFLGDVYLEMGNSVRAQTQWQRARSIDDRHHGANLRLSS